ncbi:MAG: DUF1906 domain-containing protein, partial [Ktedonobacteraceae bacterium]
MDETSTQLLFSHNEPEHRAVYLLRLFGAVLLACLLLSYCSIPAMAASQPSVSSAFSIPQQATPGDWNTIHYGGVTLAVPASWPVYDLRVHPERCALFNTHVVYFGQQDPNALCPARALGKSEALQLEALSTSPLATTNVATAAATIAGISTKVDPSSDISHTFIVVLKQVGVVIHLSYGQTPNLATHILATLHLSSEKPITPTQTAPQTQPNVTPVSQPVGVFNGLGFDACTAPSTSNMSAWLNSPYRAVGIYIGGANRACGDGNLSSSWVHSVTGSGWNLIPFYVGLQAPCNSGFATIDASQAASQGRQGADNAVNLAQGFGLGTGTLLINDMENYDISNASCSHTVMTFLSAWTQELHAKGYLSGVYSSLGSGITDLVRHSGSIQKPDTIDFASWDTVST